MHFPELFLNLKTFFFVLFQLAF